jgi:hypothetical protein
VAVDYLQDNDSPTADRWNLLFAEVNRKMLAALGGKSPAMFTGFLQADEDAILRGHIFYFGNGARPYTSFGAIYDHSIFQNLAATAPEVSRDDVLRIITVSGLDGVLHNSLEAHTRSGYYLAGQNEHFPEKIYKYAVAELVYEGSGFERVFFPRYYNKYNFFRIHNVNPYAMEFVFDGGETYTISPYASRCVRRDSVTSGYNCEWEYLWPMEAGDPRFFLPMATQNGTSVGGSYPINSMTASNVSNPSLIYYWFRQFAVFEFGGSKWWADPHVYHDVSPYYCPTYYPDPNDTTKPFGDFFCHKGEIVAGDQTRTFNGFQTITSDIPELGIASINDETLTFNAQTHLTCVSTNLLCQWDASNPTMDAGDARTLDRPRCSSNLVVYESVTGIADRQFGEGEREFSRQEMHIAHSQFALTEKPFALHRDTLATALSLNAWGSEDYAGSDQDTNVQTNTGRVLRLTPFGPRINFTQTVSLNGVAGGLFVDDIYAEVSGGSLIRKGYVQFAGFGWPIEQDAGNIGRPQDSVSLNPAHLSPRWPRAYSAYRIEDGSLLHPNIINPVSAPDGADFDVSSVADNYQETDYAFMAPVTLAAPSDLLDTRWRLWENPDGLVTGAMIRVPLLREHYNAMAQVINAVRRVRTITHTAIRFVIPPLASGEEPTVAGIPGATLFGGPFTGFPSVLPKEQYCAFQDGDGTHRAFTFLGVPIQAIGSTYRWVKISDVKNAVEALGWPFEYRATFDLLALDKEKGWVGSTDGTHKAFRSAAHVVDTSGGGDRVYANVCLLQNYHSSDLTNQSAALLNAITWEGGTGSGASSTPIGTGDSVFTFRSGQFLEIIPLWKVYIGVD